MGFSLNFRGFAPRRIGKFKCVQMPFRAVWNTSEKLYILPLEKNHQPFLDVFQTCKVVNDAHNEHVCLSSCLILPFFFPEGLFVRVCGCTNTQLGGHSYETHFCKMGSVLFMGTFSGSRRKRSLQ